MAHPLLFKEEPEDRKARQEAEYEERLVGHLLSRYGLSSYKNWLRKQNNASGTSVLTLPPFLEHFGQFPVYLSVAKIPGVTKNCTVDKLFNKMSTRKIVDVYATMRDELVPEHYQDYPFALVFPWPYIPKGMVLHDKSVTLDELPVGLKKPCVRLVWTLSKRKQRYGKYLVLEPLDQLLAAITWEPTSPYGTSTKKEE